MKKKIYFPNNESGEIILFVIFVVLFLVLFVSLFISRTLAKQSKNSGNVTSSIQAYYIADSGAENVLSILKDYDEAVNGPLTTSTVFTLDTHALPFGTGNCSAGVADVSASALKIDIIGTYNKNSRAIQLFW